MPNPCYTCFSTQPLHNHFFVPDQTPVCCEHCAATKIGCKRCCNMPNKNTFKLFLTTMIKRVVVLFVFSFQFFRFLYFSCFSVSLFFCIHFFVFLLFVIFVFQFFCFYIFLRVSPAFPTPLIFLFFIFSFCLKCVRADFHYFSAFCFSLLRWFSCFVSLSLLFAALLLCVMSYFFLLLWSCGFLFVPYFLAVSSSKPL